MARDLPIDVADPFEGVLAVVVLVGSARNPLDRMDEAVPIHERRRLVRLVRFGRPADTEAIQRDATERAVEDRGEFSGTDRFVAVFAQRSAALDGVGDGPRRGGVLVDGIEGDPFAITR